MNLGGVYDGISAAIGLQFKKTVDTVAAQVEYSHTKNGVSITFQDDIYHIHREITTRVTINGQTATFTEDRMVDATPKNDSISPGEWDTYFENKAINYFKDNFGVSKDEVDETGDGASFGQAFCVLGDKNITLITLNLFVICVKC